MELEQQRLAAVPVAAAEDFTKTTLACVAGIVFPGLGHALLGKWDRAIVYAGSICLMFFIGLSLHARLFNPDFSEFFSALKFIADAGSGSVYWIAWLRGAGNGDPSAYTYDFGNLFVYGAGLLNMLVVVDVFDISRGRKK